MKKKNIIIFGGSGLIGKTLIQSTLLKKKYLLFNLDLTIKKKNIFNQKCDVLNEKQIKDKIKIISKSHGPIYGVINATYPKVHQNKKPGNINPELFSQEIGEHFKSFLNTTQIAANLFIKKKTEGKIINFASIYGKFIPRIEIYKRTKMGMPMQYLVVKNSLITMSKYFAKFFLKNKININCISPGGIYDGQDSRFVKNYKKFSANGMLNSNDLVGITAFLLSDHAKKITGQDIIIDDGFTL